MREYGINEGNLFEISDQAIISRILQHSDFQFKDKKEIECTAQH